MKGNTCLGLNSCLRALQPDSFIYLHLPSLFCRLLAMAMRNAYFFILLICLREFNIPLARCIPQLYTTERSALLIPLMFDYIINKIVSDMNIAFFLEAISKVAFISTSVPHLRIYALAYSSKTYVLIPRCSNCKY